MIKSENRQVTDFLHDLQAHARDRYDIIEVVRDIFRKHSAELDESIKYGGIVYQRNGELLAGIFAYSSHVSVEFGKGYELEDSHAVLEGKGKYRRHIKLHDLADVKAKHVDHYAGAALE